MSKTSRRQPAKRPSVPKKDKYTNLAEWIVTGYFLGAWAPDDLNAITSVIRNSLIEAEVRGLQKAADIAGVTSDWSVDNRQIEDEICEKISELQNLIK